MSHKAILNYAERKGIELYAYYDNRYATGDIRAKEQFIPYEAKEGEDEPWCIHYSTAPLKDGKIDNDAYYSTYDLQRDDPDLIATIEELGSKAASGTCSKLKIIEIPDDVEWEIDEYDGMESVEEKHRSWS